MRLKYRLLQRFPNVFGLDLASRCGIVHPGGRTIGGTIPDGPGNISRRSVGGAGAEAGDRHHQRNETGDGNFIDDDRLSTAQSLRVSNELFPPWKVLHPGWDASIRQG